MAIATTSRRALSVLNVVRPVLRSIDRLPPRARPGLLGLILYMLLSMAILGIFDGKDASIALGVLGIGGAIVVIATVGRSATLYVVILLAFCMFIIYLNRRPPVADTVIKAHEPVESEVKTPGVVPKMTGDDSALIAGNVRYRTTNAAVQGAFVDVEGYGAGSDTTDAKGYFEIRVPRRIITLHRDSVTLAILTTQTTMFTAPFDGRPYGITVEPPAAPVASVPPLANGRATLALRLESPGAHPAGSAGKGEQDGFRARLVLDSVKTLHDGSASDTYWRFDLNVNSLHAITIRQRAYDRRAGKNLLHLGGEVTIVVPQASPRLSLHIRGLRDAFIGVHQVNGHTEVEGQSLQPEQPVSGAVLVRGDNPNNGEFVFYYTLVRRGIPNIRANAAGGST
jgi:hypothetical protein